MIKDTKFSLGTFQNPFPQNYSRSRIIRKSLKDNYKKIVQKYNHDTKKIHPGFQAKKNKLYVVK